MGFDNDQSVATELIQYTENDGNIYRQMTQSILTNLATKKARGNYDSDLAVQAFMHLAEAGAKKYAKEFGGVWHEHFPIQIRRMAATHWRDEFETEYKLGNYNNLLPLKYRHPSPEQASALVHFAKIVGRNWKRELSDCWMRAQYPAPIPEDLAAPLQQIRNDLGPSWLANAKLSTLRAQAEADRGALARALSSDEGYPLGYMQGRGAS